MKRLILPALLASFATASSADMAQSFCMEPQAPTTAFLRRPEQPFCVRTGSTCSRYDLESYRNDVRAFNIRLRGYAAEVDRFYEEARTYVRCMSRPL